MKIKKLAFDMKRDLQKSPKSKRNALSRLSFSPGRFDFLLGIMRKTKIQVRLIVSFLIISIFPLIVVGIITYSKSSNAIQTKIIAYSGQLIERIGSEVSSEFTKMYDLAKEISISPQIQKLSNFDNMENYDRIVAQTDLKDYFLSKFINTKQIKFASVFLVSGNEIAYGNYGNYNSILTLFDEAKASKERKLILFYHSSDSTLYLISAKLVSIDTGKTIGTIIIGLDEQCISTLYKDINIGEGAELFILDSKGTVVSSRNKEIALGEENKVSPKIVSSIEKESTKSNNFKTKDCLITYVPVANVNYCMVASIPLTNISSDSKSILNNIVVVILICMIIAALFTVIISGSIASPLKKLNKIIKAAKEGDLTVGMPDQGKDELTEVSMNFNKMLTHINSLIGEVQNSSDIVLKSASKITQSSGASFTASSQVAVTIQEVAKGAAQQSIDISDNVEQMNRLSNNINKVDEDIVVVSKIVADTSLLSQNALNMVELLKTKALESNSVSNLILDDMRDLNNSTNEIVKIVKLIGGISEQTNLLSLNASIEAARAGDAGRVFAVVADEVKKLSQQSKDASVSIGNIINDIVKKTQKSANEVYKANIAINEQLEAVKNTDKAFNTIYNAMLKISDQVGRVQVSVKEILESKRHSMNSIENISSVSQETSAIMEQLAATTEQQMAGSEELANLSKNLSDMSQNLNKAMSIFKVTELSVLACSVPKNESVL